MEQQQSASHWWPTCGVMLAGLTVALNNGVLHIAIPSMMSSLGTDLDRIQWVQTAFQITEAVLIPAVGWLAARLGTKWLFLSPPSRLSPVLPSQAWRGTCILSLPSVSSRVSGWPHQPVVHEHLIPHLSHLTNAASPWGCITSAIPLVRPLPQLLVGISSRSSTGGRFFISTCQSG